MLDSRTSLPTERAHRAAVRPKGAGLLEALTARPAQPDGLSFGSVLSNTLSDRRVTPASGGRAAAAEASSSAEARQSARRKAAQRDGDTRDESPDAVAQDASQRTDRPDLQDSASADQQAGDADAPAPKDPSPMDASQPTADAAAPDSTQQATLAAAAGASSPATAADPANPATSTDAAALGQPSPAKVAGPGLTPLQWMAQQQVARLNARTEQARAGIPVQSADTNSPSSVPGATAPNKQAAPVAMPVAQQVMADLIAPAAASNALGVLKAPQDGSGDLPSSDPAATATTHVSPMQAHSATTDPVGLLNPLEGSTYTAAPQSHSPSAPAHAMAGSPAGAQPNVTLPPTADDNAVQNMQRLAAMVHAKVGQGHSVTRMQLQPPELGAVTAVVLLRQGKMDLRLEVANEAARDLVTDGLGRLRDSLQQQGISLDRATVSVAPRNEHAANDQQQPAWTGPQDNNPSGQFHSGQGQEQGDRSFAASFAMDVPAAAGEGAADVAAAFYAAGLNVLA